MIMLCFFPPNWALGRPNNAKDLVSRFQTELIVVMKHAKELGVEGRYKKLAPLLSDTFHIPLMTRIAVGKFWKTATTKQRNRLIQAFQKMSLSTLATLFSSYSGEVFKFVAETSENQSNTWIVSTKLIKSDGDEVDIAYVATRFSEKWWLIDVILDNGISELKVRLSEYDNILKEGGTEALISTLEQKAAQLMTSEGN